MPDIDDGDIELRRVYAEAENAVRYTPLQNIADQARKRRVHSSNRINFIDVNRAVKILLIQQSDEFGMCRRIPQFKGNQLRHDPVADFVEIGAVFGG